MTTRRTMGEELVHRCIGELVEAIRAKDVDRVLSFYAPEVRSFDLDPPLGYEGTSRKRSAWQAVFARYEGPLGYELRELRVTTNGDLAFAHSLNHVSGTLTNGRSSDLWVRWTACLQRTDGIWLVVHDHVSIPADLEHGRAATDLTP